MDKLQHQTYQDEIHSLQEEIRLLEQQSQNSQSYMGSFLRTIDMQREKFSVRNHESWKCSNTDLEAQIDQAESQIALLTQLTGIAFTKCVMTTVGKGNDKRKQYRLSGYSHSLQFDLEFELMEVQAKENVITTVTELNIIMESNEFCDLSRFISRAEEKKSLLLFFRTLSTFAKWYEFRQITFKHFKEQYPKVVRLPEGPNSEYMVLECSKVPGIELKIFWKIFVSEEGVVIPVLDLLPKIPVEALDFDTEKVVDNAPNSFRNLMRLFGIEAAIDHLINLM
ncbi:centromere protein P [Hemiscyllium ocellatum]|uniref:centromere protein P n=1 Tax=Hemiscyllium ocellatum TaxID=170820 RepID=UPI00296772FF|nr:centromere protein P [Hemiscyllium ocellatum]XP_060691482.1 centromere protein P [Hemiscyllium ocellatum]XP_060691483.1 centromere protein P [Hemiscyllium ocellatum]